MTSDEQDVVSTDLPEAALVSGRELVATLVFWSHWAHRKVEAVALLEGERARRRVSLDLTVPQLLWRSIPTGELLTLVPLALIAKRDLRQFDAIDDSGTSTPILNRDQNEALSCQLLRELIRAEASAEIEVFLDGDAEALIQTCVAGLAPESVEAARGLIERFELWETFSGKFLFDLAEQFLLCAALPASRVGSRRVIKYSYHWTASSSGGQRRARWMAGWLSTVAAFGYRPFELDVDLGRFETGRHFVAKSSHLEVQAPSGLHCVDLALQNSAGVEITRDSAPGNVAHARSTPTDPAVRGVVRFDPDLSGIHRLVTWAAWGVAVILWVVRWQLHRESPDPGTPVSLLLFGPALLLTWLVRPGENWIVSAIVGPLRFFALVLALLLFGGAAVVAFTESPFSDCSGGGILVDVAWTSATLTAAVGAVGLTIGRILIRARLGRRGGTHGR